MFKMKTAVCLVLFLCLILTACSNKASIQSSNKTTSTLEGIWISNDFDTMEIFIDGNYSNDYINTYNDLMTTGTYSLDGDKLTTISAYGSGDSYTENYTIEIRDNKLSRKDESGHTVKYTKFCDAGDMTLDNLARLALYKVGGTDKTASSYDVYHCEYGSVVTLPANPSVLRYPEGKIHLFVFDLKGDRRFVFTTDNFLGVTSYFYANLETQMNNVKDHDSDFYKQQYKRLKEQIEALDEIWQNAESAVESETAEQGVWHKISIE